MLKNLSDAELIYETNNLTREGLVEEVLKLRDAIRKHRDFGSTMRELYASLPDSEKPNNDFLGYAYKGT